MLLEPREASNSRSVRRWKLESQPNDSKLRDSDDGTSIQVKQRVYFLENAVVLEKIIIDPVSPIFSRLPLDLEEIEHQQTARNLSKLQLEGEVPPAIELVILGAEIEIFVTMLGNSSSNSQSMCCICPSAVHYPISGRHAQDHVRLLQNTGASRILRAAVASATAPIEAKIFLHESESYSGTWSTIKYNP
ncbi:hypothetical protein K7X08_002247 [Anisodus acutangulus]|uniref:Uncharacterized protein n=1 Tax=Anisodus acutangulus TaxID=402998 RepID=A0A9Q1R747_9SOLA|nr:hypothetical protein K7X08_002247 [Anisodus acutangulus]